MTDNLELVWVQNLRSFIRDQVGFGDEWRDIFVERLDATVADNRRLQEALAAAEARITETRKKALEEAARAAYAFPSYVLGALQTDEDGVLLPGSPYDRGRYEAYRAIRSISNEDAPK